MRFRNELSSLAEVSLYWVRALSGPMHLGLKTGPILGYRSPVPLAKFQMAPIPSSLMSSGSRKMEPRYACLSEAKASHSHKMWTEVSPSVPHFLQMGSLHSPLIFKCLLKVLCPVNRPITTLDCVLLKGRREGTPFVFWHDMAQSHFSNEFSLLSLLMSSFNSCNGLQLCHHE